MKRYKYYDEDYEILKHAFNVLSEEMWYHYLHFVTYEDKRGRPFIFVIYDCNLHLPKTLYLDKRFVTDNKPIHDTINITNDSIHVKDSLVTVEKIPNMFIKSLDSISIDTINTVVNGKVTESKIKVTIK